MPRGPLPDPHAQRRNAATIPTTDLPAEGRTGPVPDPPPWVSLGVNGRAWWDWVWTSQEAAAWGTGALDTAARRATLEDDLWVVEVVASFNVRDLIEQWDGSREDLADAIEAAFRSLGRQVAGKKSIIQEMSKLDVELGLTPKSKQNLRWRVVGETVTQAPVNPVAEPPTPGSDPRDRLTLLAGGGSA